MTQHSKMFRRVLENVLEGSLLKKLDNFCNNDNYLCLLQFLIGSFCVFVPVVIG